MPKGKAAKTPFSTFKQDVNSHGVPGGPEFDVGVFEFAQGCLQVVQPPTLSFSQFAMPVCSALVF
jgi:hypothetical protein